MPADDAPPVPRKVRCPRCKSTHVTTTTTTCSNCVRKKREWRRRQAGEGKKLRHCQTCGERFLSLRAARCASCRVKGVRYERSRELDDVQIDQRLNDLERQTWNMASQNQPAWSG